MCPPSYRHSGFVTTHALGLYNELYNEIKSPSHSH